MGCSTEGPDIETEAQGLQVDDAELAAQSRAANFELMRGRLKRAAQVELDEIRTRLPDDLIVYSSTTSASQVLGTGGGDLLPPSCRTSVTSEPPDYEAAARCFIGAKSSLMLDGPDNGRGSAPELIVVGNETGGRADVIEQYLRFEQQHRGYPVEARSITAVFIDRRLASVSGRFAGTSRFSAPSVDDAAIRSAARALVDLAGTSPSYLYDPDTGAFEASFIGADEVEHRFDANSGELRWSKVHGHPLEVTKNHLSYTYPIGTYLGVSNTVSTVSALARCDNYSGTCNVPSSGVCTFRPRPQNFYQDRISHVYTSYDGSPMYELVNYADCASTNVFTTTPYDQLDLLPRYAASARTNVDQLESILNHSESFFWVYPRFTTNLKVEVSSWPDDEGAAGWYFPSSHRMKLYHDTFSGSGARRFARELAVIAHEYGHYVHHTYGLAQNPPTTLTGSNQVREGWADQFALRVATHHRFVSGLWPGVGYLTDIKYWRDHRFERTRHFGEWVYKPSPVQVSVPPNTYPWLTHPNPWCLNDDLEQAPYICGSLIGMTYWALVHDRCVFKYRSCTTDAQIVQHNGGYLNSAWRLANSAYAYALKATSGSADVAEFHGHVVSRYAQFRAAGYISNADENRVQSVLAMHCLGPLNVCPGLHKLPGSLLPSAHTEKDALYVEAESGQRSGTANAVFAPNSASGNWFVSMGGGGELRLFFNLPQAGHYRIHFVVQPWNATTAKVRAFDWGTYAWKTMGPLTPYQVPWAWRKHPSANVCEGAVRFLNAGVQDLYLDTSPGDMADLKLDAVWLEHIPAPNGCP